jgi:glucokinase
MREASVLTFDVGGSKTAWGVVTASGELLKEGRFITPREPAAFVDELLGVVEKHGKEVQALGIGIAGTVSADHRHTLICPNIPGLSHLDLREALEETKLPLSIDNDGRAALVGEAWQGAAQDKSSVLLLTLGTGVGGGVMQRRVILPHPTDISQELSHFLVDHQDFFPATAGKGTVEALIGGKNLEERYGVSLQEMAERVRKNDAEAIEFWQHVSFACMKCLRALVASYGSSAIIIGGVGVHDLEYYVQESPPCPVIPATLGEQAALYGMARIAFDELEEADKDWDES